ncbi:hypothetical protein AWV79_10075 [Cupriavidus sp. UYMMa02A]|nr:hypothetical protein AWV79_10075 [Cupriavidus sp. UYMMa02A]
MAKSEVITVSMQELDRLKTVQAVVDGQLRPGVAAERLEITDRQFRRLLERYRQEGPSGLLSHKRGHPRPYAPCFVVRDIDQTVRIVNAARPKARKIAFQALPACLACWSQWRYVSADTQRHGAHA